MAGSQVVVNKDDVCKLVSNSQKTKWKVVSSTGVECQVPGVCFLIPPPDPEAVEAAERLKRQYDRCEALWLKKQMRMSINMIFATIKVLAVPSFGCFPLTRGMWMISNFLIEPICSGGEKLGPVSVYGHGQGST